MRKILNCRLENRKEIGDRSTPFGFWFRCLMARVIFWIENLNWRQENIWIHFINFNTINNSYLVNTTWQVQTEQKDDLTYRELTAEACASITGFLKWFQTKNIKLVYALHASKVVNEQLNVYLSFHPNGSSRYLKWLRIKKKTFLVTRNDEKIYDCGDEEVWKIIDSLNEKLFIIKLIFKLHLVALTSDQFLPSARRQTRWNNLQSIKYMKWNLLMSVFAQLISCFRANCKKRDKWHC